MHDLWKQDEGKFIITILRVIDTGEILKVYGVLKYKSETLIQFNNIKNNTKTRYINPDEVEIVDWSAEEVKK